MLYRLAKQHAEMKAKMAKDEEEAPRGKGPKLEVAIGVGKKPPSEDILEGEEEEPSEEMLPELGDEEEPTSPTEHPDAAMDEMLIRQIVAEELDKRLGTK